MPDNHWCVYLLECSDKTLYCGVTLNLVRRVNDHNNGLVGAKYTRGRRPVKLVWSESQPNRSLALSREAVIKKLSRAEKLLLIKSNWTRFITIQ